MEDKKDGFVIYKSFYRHIRDLNQAQKAFLLDAIFCYAIDKTELPPLDGITDMAFSFIKDAQDRAEDKYKATCRKNRLNGLKKRRKDLTRELQVSTDEVSRQITQEKLTALECKISELENEQDPLPTATDRYRPIADSDRERGSESDRGCGRGWEEDSKGKPLTQEELKANVYAQIERAKNKGRDY